MSESDRIHVPYLFPSGMILPKFFEDNLSDAAGFNNRSVHFGEYHRTVNGKEIDRSFKYFIKNGENMPTVASCAVECKYWADDLPLGDLKSIIERAVKNSAKLSLFFCNSVGGAKGTTFDSFKENCAAKNGM